MIATSLFVAEWHHHWTSCETFSFAKERHDWRRTVHQVTLGPPQRAPAWCNQYWTRPLWVELLSCMRIRRTHGNGSSPSRSVGAATAHCWVELGETPIWTCTKDSGPADWVWVRRRRGGGQGEEGGEAAARSEPRLVRACFHAADGCDAPSLRRRRMAETRWRSACRDRC